MAQIAVQTLWRSVGFPVKIVDENLCLIGDAYSTLPSSFNLGVAAQASIAASGLAAAHFHSLNTGKDIQKVSVDAKHAALEFDSEKHYTINGKPCGGLWDDLSGIYPTKDHSFVRIHTNFPHHRAGILSILGLDSTATRQTVGTSILQWNSKEFEEVAARHKMCATAFRSFEEWDKHPHAKAIKNALPVELIRVSDAPKREPTRQTSKRGVLEGVRVLDLTRVIAGPVCGRTLAAHGADTLWVTSPNLPSLPNLDPDTSRGKRTTQLDLTSQEDLNTLLSLIKEGDVFLQAYRPNGLEEKGCGPSDLAAIRQGIICANLRAWGWDGPWKDRRGFDSLVQTATGFNHDESVAFSSFKGTVEETAVPKPFPVQALDHAAGYLLTFGILSAFCKSITEGGSWEVRVSLAGVGNWIRSLGRLGPRGFQNTQEISPEHKFFTCLCVRRKDHLVSESSEEPSEGESYMSAVSHSALLEEIPAPLLETSVRLGLDSPIWIQRV